MSNPPPAACLIGWPVGHSRSPLIHHYWLRTLGIEGGYDSRRCRRKGLPISCCGCRPRLRRRQCHPSAQGARAGADQAGRACPRRRRRQYAVVRGRRAAFDQHRRRRFYRQSRRLRARLGRARMRWCWAPAARRARWCSGCSSAASSACIWSTAPSSAPARWRINSARAFSRLHGRRSANCCRAPGCW